VPVLSVGERRGKAKSRIIESVTHRSIVGMRESIEIGHGCIIDPDTQRVHLLYFVGPQHLVTRYCCIGLSADPTYCIPWAGLSIRAPVRECLAEVLNHAVAKCIGGNCAHGTGRFRT